ncbi:ribonuclease Z [Pullulanibacillus pueri]|uniref:Ribonuclease Z n=1 Tax=Pullulanibacillus pueri TaxID=1437324 RepID=A0A8J2ZVL5_9BACL|nr:ribonuclease Z [Pullulanibacillus pueri]MBM7681626.1 ribonuclease Z [Pullulanibacillus pueri]GGH79402.1 ribonuclease Z [Pullulanibacillus pueri]
MELLFLGTGAGVPAKHRNVSALALIMPEYKGETWLFDCGEATQHQILHTKVKLPRIKKIFISHLHGDHIFGLPGLLGSRSFQGEDHPLEIYGPPGLRTYIETSLALSGTHLTYPLKIIELVKGVIYEDETFRISTDKLAHVIDSYGFRIQEKNKPGKLLVDKIKHDLGVIPGPELKKFKEEPIVKLADGSQVESAHYLGPEKQGRILTILGDTKPCPEALELAREADVVVHESTFRSDKEEGANTFGHSTARQAATLAKNAAARTLILTHISSRYQEDVTELLDEARLIFNPCFLAEDFWSYTL